MANLQGEGTDICALLEAHADWSKKRLGFRNRMRRRIAGTLVLRPPKLDRKAARDITTILLQNMKMVGVLREELGGDALTGALAELGEMTRLYLEARVG